MNQYWENNIEVLLEQLKLLRITEEDALDRTTETEIIDTMLIALVLIVYNEQVVISKSIILDPG